MALTKTLLGEKVLIQIGDGSGPPEVFAHDCLINLERGVQMSSETTEVIVPDCDDPSAAAWKEVFKDGLSIPVSGGGLLHTASIETWFTWWKVDTAKNVRINFNTTGALGGGYIAVPMKLTSFNITGTRKNYATAEVTLMSHGAAAWTDNA